MAAKFSDTGMVAIIRHNGMYYPVRAECFTVTSHHDGRASIELKGWVDAAFGYANADQMPRNELPPVAKELEPRSMRQLGSGY